MERVYAKVWSKWWERLCPTYLVPLAGGVVEFAYKDTMEWKPRPYLI